MEFIFRHTDNAELCSVSFLLTIRKEAQLKLDLNCPDNCSTSLSVVKTKSSCFQGGLSIHWGSGAEAFQIEAMLHLISPTLQSKLILSRNILISSYPSGDHNRCMWSCCSWHVGHILHLINNLGEEAHSFWIPVRLRHKSGTWLCITASITVVLQILRETALGIWETIGFWF